MLGVLKIPVGGMTLASILVVDSDSNSRAKIAKELRQLGYDVKVSEDIETAALDESTTDPEAVSAGGISVDAISHRVVINGDYVALAPREYRLLLFLLTNQDRVFSRKQLMLHVWDRASAAGSRTVDVHIRRLRSILEPYGYARYVQTVRGTGYHFSLKS